MEKPMDQLAPYYPQPATGMAQATLSKASDKTSGEAILMQMASIYDMTCKLTERLEEASNRIRGPVPREAGAPMPGMPPQPAPSFEQRASCLLNGLADRLRHAHEEMDRIGGFY